MIESKFMNEMNTRAEVRGAMNKSRQVIIKTMRRRFGESPSHEKMISQIDNLEGLERMESAFLDVTSWDALLEIQ